MTFKQVKAHWEIITACVLFFSAIGAYQIRVSHAEEQIKENKTEIAAVKAEITTIRVSAESVKTAAEAQAKAAVEAQRVTERQIDQIIQQLQRIQ